MSKQENTFDNIIKQSLEGQRFEFQEAYWEQAKLVLKENHASSKLSPAFNLSYKHIFLALLIIFSLATFSLWMWSFEHKQSQSLVVKEGRGQKTEDKVQSTEDIGRGKEERGQAKEDKGQNIKDKGYRRKEIGQKAEEKGDRIDERIKNKNEGIIGGNTNIFELVDISPESENSPSPTYVEPSHLKNIDLEDIKQSSQSLSLTEIEHPISISLYGALDDPDALAPKELLKQRINRHQLGIVMGGVLSLGLKNGSANREELSTGLLLGLRYAYSLKPDWLLETGIRLQTRGGLNAAKDYEVLQYSFGYQKETIRLSSERAYYLNIPLSINYRLKGRHYVGMGVNYARLIDGQGEKTKITEDSFNLRLARPTEETNWGYTHGLNTDSWGLMMKYSYYLSKGMHLGFETQYGLNDLTSGDYFENEMVDKDFQIRLHFTYDLLRK